MKHHIGSKMIELMFIIINAFILIFLLNSTNIAAVRTIDTHPKSIVICWAILVVYIVLSYLFNCYNTDVTKYTVKMFAITVTLNVIFTFVFSGFFFTRKIAMLIFFISCLFQVIFKMLLVSRLSNNENLLILRSPKGKTPYAIQDIKGIKNFIHYAIKDTLTIDTENESYQKFIENPLKYVNDHRITTIVLETKNLPIALEEILFNLKMQGIYIQQAIDLYEYINGKIHIRTIDFKWFLFHRGFDNLHSSVYRKAKRLFDLFFASLILLLTSPVILITAIAIKLESKGGVFFAQERIGLNNQPFTIYKLRSMKHDAEKDGAKWAVKGDMRVTRIGNFIRKTRIDELPQCFNIIKGDMSFVGPRPERDVFIQELKKVIPFYDVRHFAKPGVTGWAQVNYPYGASIEDSEEKLKYDLYYLKHATVWLDLAILIRTVKTVIGFKGR